MLARVRPAAGPEAAATPAEAAPTTANRSRAHFAALEPIAAAPDDDDLPHAVRRRMAVDLRTLALAGRARFGQAGAGDLWDALAAEAEEAIEAEAAAG